MFAFFLLTGDNSRDILLLKSTSWSLFLATASENSLPGKGEEFSFLGLKRDRGGDEPLSDLIG
jgi:hypothetical protein